MGRKTEAGARGKAAVAVEQQRTTRTVARWEAVRQSAPFVSGAIGAIGVAAALAGEATVVAAHLNAALGVSLTVVVPAGLVKVLWDRSQKRRQRARIQELEAENRKLTREAGVLDGRIAELSRRVGSAD